MLLHAKMHSKRSTTEIPNIINYMMFNVHFILWHVPKDNLIFHVISFLRFSSSVSFS